MPGRMNHDGSNFRHQSTQFASMAKEVLHNVDQRWLLGTELLRKDLADFNEIPYK